MTVRRHFRSLAPASLVSMLRHAAWLGVLLLLLPASAWAESLTELRHATLPAPSASVHGLRTAGGRLLAFSDGQVLAWSAGSTQWQPVALPAGATAIEFAYLLHWGDLPDDPTAPLAIVHETRAGHGGFAGVEAQQGTRKFVVDFKGGLVGAMEPEAEIEPIVTIANGEITGSTIEKIAGTDIWRLVIDISAAEGAVVELSAHLAGYDRRLTENWLYQWIVA